MLSKAFYLRKKFCNPIQRSVVRIEESLSNQLY